MFLHRENVVYLIKKTHKLLRVKFFPPIEIIFSFFFVFQKFLLFRFLEKNPYLFQSSFTNENIRQFLYYFLEKKKNACHRTNLSSKFSYFPQMIRSKANENLLDL